MDCFWLPVVHTDNDFITVLPVTEGMLTSGVSAADVQQLLTRAFAVMWIDLGVYNAIPILPDGHFLVGAFFNLGEAPIIILVPIVETLMYSALARCRGRGAA